MDEQGDNRVESDSLGPREVPASHFWGRTRDARSSISQWGDTKMPIAIIHALALVKRAAAEVNRDLGLLPPELSEAIGTAAREVESGRPDGEFPLSVWQTGSGTQTNMNVDEVIANRANEMLREKRGSKRPIHPNDHVNPSQSSNACFPTNWSQPCAASGGR
jgi:fumarate hydratase class II